MNKNSQRIKTALKGQNNLSDWSFIIFAKLENILCDENIKFPTLIKYRNKRQKWIKQQHETNIS